MHDDEKFELDDFDDIDEIDDVEDLFGDDESFDLGSGFEDEDDDDDEMEPEEFVMREVSDSFEIDPSTFKKFEAKPRIQSLFAPPSIRKK